MNTPLSLFSLDVPRSSVPILVEAMRRATARRYVMHVVYISMDRAAMVLGDSVTCPDCTPLNGGYWCSASEGRA